MRKVFTGWTRWTSSDANMAISRWTPWLIDPLERNRKSRPLSPASGSGTTRHNRSSTSAHGRPPAGYEAFLETLKTRIRETQVRAALFANRALVMLYWNLGRDILSRQQQQGWGTKVIDRLAVDLRWTTSGTSSLSWDGDLPSWATNIG
jgi:hypothetical protein